MYDKLNFIEEIENGYLYDFFEFVFYGEENYYDGNNCYLYKK